MPGNNWFFSGGAAMPRVQGVNNTKSAPPSNAFVASWSARSEARAGGLSRWTRNRFRDAPEDRRNFHRSLPGYAVTPLVDLPELARELGVARLMVKDESSRLGLPAFKMLGASWAVYRCVAQLCEDAPEPTLAALREAVSGLPPITLVTATDGNHGRAVARMASYLGLRALVLIPSAVSTEAINLVRSEGADVDVLELTYDETVAEAARRAENSANGSTTILVQDTSWTGYEKVPRWIVDGYSTLFDEAADQLPADRTLLIVPAGVGSLAHAAVLQCHRHAGWRAITVEPEVAPCIAASLAAGVPVSTGTGQTTMAGLNCGTPSSLAFSDLLATLDGGVWVTDDEAAAASDALAAHGIDAGACGAASLAGLRHLAAFDEVRRTFEHSTVLLLNTEATR